jgi:hypothetical protein
LKVDGPPGVETIALHEGVKLASFNAHRSLPLDRGKAAGLDQLLN